MRFRILGLSPAEFAPLTRLPDEALAARGVQRCRVESSPGYPCRISLEDAEPGETVLLLNYEHLPLDSPFRSRHAIYVREQATVRYEGIDRVPTALKRRLLSVRAFDPSGMLLDADVVDGTAVAPLIVRMLEDPRAAFLHAHYAKPGCFAARIERA